MWNGTRWTEPYHEWGEEDFDWEGLNEAGAFIQKYLKERADVSVGFKEKYGTLRLELYHGFDETKSFIYNMAYQNAIRLWPHLHDEILCDADYEEYIQNYHLHYVEFEYEDNADTNSTDTPDSPSTD